MNYIASFCGEPRGDTSTLETEHTIRLKKGSRPVAVKSRLYTPQQKKEIENYVSKLSNRMLIQPSKPGNPWRSAIHLAKKKDGTWRFCIDYRKVNSLTELDAYPLPNIEYMLDN